MKRIYLIGFIIIGVAIPLVLVKLNMDDPNTTTQSDVVVFSNIESIGITQNSVTLVGKTSVPVICEIEFAEYLEDPIFVSDVDVKNNPHTEHSVTIYDLNPDSTYNYRFQTNFDNKDFYSNIRTFTTPTIEN